MPAPTQPTEKPPVPEPFIYVLPGMPGIFGVLHKKQFIGDNDREIVPEDIWKASLLMFLAEGILMVVLLMILAAVR
mgnify:CR=1 FL=1